LNKGVVAVNWNWLTKAILWHGNTINASLGYEIYTEPLDRNVCESCHIIKKTPDLVFNEMDKQLISSIICPGCQCALPAK